MIKIKSFSEFDSKPIIFYILPNVDIEALKTKLILDGISIGMSIQVGNYFKIIGMSLEVFNNKEDIPSNISDIRVLHYYFDAFAYTMDMRKTCNLKESSDYCWKCSNFVFPIGCGVLLEMDNEDNSSIK